MRALRFTQAAPACVLNLFIAGCAELHGAEPDTALDAQLRTEVELFARTDDVSFPAPCQVLFVGSSSIRMWNTLSQDMAPLPVINRGFGASHIEHVTRWFEQLVAPHRPRSIVFYARENDVAAGKSSSSVIADFDAFMERKRTALGDVPVYFISLKPSRLRFEQLRRQSQVNAAIRMRAAKRADLYYMDVASPMLQNGEPRDLFTADNLHMTRDGYVIWTQVVRAALLPNAESEARNCATTLSARPRASLCCLPRDPRLDP